MQVSPDFLYLFFVLNLYKNSLYMSIVIILIVIMVIILIEQKSEVNPTRVGVIANAIRVCQRTPVASNLLSAFNERPQLIHIIDIPDYII
jgi:hypothetical protein